MVYVEAAPNDLVVLRNLSPEGWQVARVDWRLQESEGELIFDTVAGGEGVDSAHAFAFTGGSAGVRLADVPLVSDGAREMTLLFDAYPAGAAFEFSIDLDDTALGLPDTIVDGREIEGAAIEVAFRNDLGLTLVLTGRFGADAIARVDSPCTS
jgi:hypothetical protein